MIYMKYRVSRKEHAIPTKEFTNKKEAINYAKSFRIKSGVPIPMIEKINNVGESVGRINLNGDDIRVTSSAQIKAQAKYDKDHTKSIHLKFNIEYDSDILKKFEEVESKQGYIKELIRADIYSSGS